MACTATMQKRVFVCGEQAHGIHCLPLWASMRHARLCGMHNAMKHAEGDARVLARAHTCVARS